MTRKTEYNSQEIKHDQRDEEQDTGFPQRVETLIERFGSITRIAKKCGFSEGVVRSWRDGRSDPSRRRCVALARGLGISLIWLMTGAGTMSTAEACTPSRSAEAAESIDTKRLSHAVQLLQSTLGNTGNTGNDMVLEKRVETLIEIYTALGRSDAVSRAEDIGAIHRHLAERLRKSRIG